MSESNTSATESEAAPVRSPRAETCRQVEQLCAESISECFQCLKCSAGCPMAEHVDLPPAKIMRLLQLGQLDEVLHSEAIWMCAGCLTCSTRCPNEIDIAHVMDRLRHEAIARGIEPPRERIAGFHRSFLKSVRRHGRNFESGSLAGYALKNGQLMKNMGLGMTMFFKGKLPMLPKNVSGRAAIRRMFEHHQRKLAEKKES